MQRTALLLSLLLLGGCQAKGEPPRQPAPPPVRLTAPTSCGGHTVTVQRADPPDTQPRVEVVGDGKVYSDFKGVAYQGAWFARAGAEAPLLVVSRQSGGKTFLQAYRCQSGPSLLKPVLWDGVGELEGTFEEPGDQAVKVNAVFEGSARPLLYRWRDGQLHASIPPDVRQGLQRVQQFDLAPGVPVTVRTRDDGQLQPVQRVELVPGVPPTFRVLDDGQFHAGGGPLLVTGADGRTLLERLGGVLGVEGVRKAGETPLLLVSVPGGGSMGTYYEAYRLDSGQGRLVPVAWGDQSFLVSRDPVLEVPGGLASSYRTESPAGWRVATVRWEYRDGALHRAATSIAPPAYPDHQPSGSRPADGGG